MVTFTREQHQEIKGELIHYGTPRHSGRYPWGSGEDPHQSSTGLMAQVEEFKRQGMSETDIARGLGMTTTALRALKSVARAERLQDQIHQAKKLKEKGMSNAAIAERMGLSGESQVRQLLKPSQERKSKVIDNVTDTLRKAVDEKGYLDVGAGIEYQLGITNNKLRTAIKKLEADGYPIHQVKVVQLGTGNETNMRVLTRPGTTWGEAQRNRDQIQQLNEYSSDGGMTILGMLPPKSIDLSRVGVRYGSEGGKDADGVIYVRPGVKDVTLGKSRYAQVRIAVNGTHYLKGMAAYKDDLPDGVDLLFNTNKESTGNKLDAMKKLKRLRAEGDDPNQPDKFTGPVDQDNPFGASISRQIGEGFNPKTGKPEKLTSVMNIVNDEGKWNEWSKNLSTQVLSKQEPDLAKKQLLITYEKRKAELETIKKLTNPAVRRKLLEAFADGTDSAAVHMKAAAMPGQKTQVLMPIPSLKENEAYAPNFRNGTRLALVRFPHGGRFEIPEVVVNNKVVEGRKILGDGRDAIGINPKVAERLSGADFDGDTVLAIPNDRGLIKTAPALSELENFDPKSLYAAYPGMPRMTDHEKGMQMGLVSNLITDMTIQGAEGHELARAVRHSMVVIDAEKHYLDFRRSAQDHNISALMAKYQNSPQGGAATIISKARSPLEVRERKLRSAKDGGPIDKETGEKVYVETGRSRKWIDSNGVEREVFKTTKTTKLAEAKDASELSSGSPMEAIYVAHSNNLKKLANDARKELIATESRTYSASARRVYEAEVKSLESKLNLALENAPRERQAQVFANAIVKAKIQANPRLTTKEGKDDLKKIKSQALHASRLRTQAEKKPFSITEREWEAIQRGAISNNKLNQILSYADLDEVKQLATPRDVKGLSAAQVARAQRLRDNDYTQAEIADALGVSVSTVLAAFDN